MHKKYALLVGDSANFALPLIEVSSFHRLRKQVLDDLKTMVQQGEPPWWAPKADHGSQCTLNWPSFGRVSSVAECFAISILEYEANALSIDLRRSRGMIYVSWIPSRGWCVGDKTDGGWTFGPYGALPDAAFVKWLMNAVFEGDATLGGEWLDRLSFKPRVRVTFSDSVSYSQEMCGYGGTCS